ncbi:hydroxymethylbilane synthase [Flavihumibacter rivuli]|uniref:hydroxymethylbilane synthase n=1 Tax=Flavihumibacter rivuli TaxID=2838156 RepID=UPI001BDEF52A|nr:hydroxymethylbilane synthase [Flavihumibacter rivuli]ULQ55052.1 hydroxymethylbilane synthase [Flavihumibacter rivuli]
MQRILRIGTRDSQLAVWQATTVQSLLAANGIQAELVYIKSEGDLDLHTPLYAMGVQGVFTRALDSALLNDRIDIAVHSMKDVPVQLAIGIEEAAVLERASHKDILVYKEDATFLDHLQSYAVIATSSIRRKAQWLNRYPNHRIENLRGNVNTRLRKVAESDWNGAIFAAAGLERIALRPEQTIDLDWMLPAPAQGAIMVVARANDPYALEACAPLNHQDTATCVKQERSFLSALMGGCSTPISAFARMEKGALHFTGSVLSADGADKLEIERIESDPALFASIGSNAAKELIQRGADQIIKKFRQNG